jgi:diguanylate cyclase (GGDEF)-like protein
VTSTTSTFVLGLARANRLRSAIFAVLGLAVVLGTLALAIVLTQSQSRNQLRTNFALRATSSATLVSTYLSEQANRQQQTGRRFLSEPHVSAGRFALVVQAFGGQSGGLFDSTGRLLAIVPREARLIGQPVAARYAHLQVAERGRVAVSNVVKSAAKALPVMAVAVPYQTPRGRRVFSVAYRDSSSTLDALVDHAIAYPQHEVLLEDGAGRILASSPDTKAETLAAADPRLARAALHGSAGSVPGMGTATTFTTAAVPGTAWRLVIAVPDSHLFNSISGWSHAVPWLVFALVTILGLLLVVVFGRSLVDRMRLATLSARMEKTARTDSLTQLNNRRALSDHLTRAAAHARRRSEPLSVLMIDLDRFKETNDGFGHEAGDQVLCTIADCMHEVFRSDDVYGRWGGDEFLAILPDTDADGAACTAARLRAAAAAVELGEIGLPDGVPLSVGIASGVHTAPHDLVREADLALYRAKAAGSEDSYAINLDPNDPRLQAAYR